MTGAPSCRRLRSLRPARRSATPPRRRNSAGISRRRAWRRCRRADHATACHPQTAGTGAEGRASSSRNGRFPRSFPLPPEPPADTAATPHQAGRSPCHAAAGPAETGNDPEKQSFRPEHPPRPSCHLVTKSVAVDGFRTLPRCHALFHPIALQPERPDLVWTGDITYIATQEGWLYLAVVIDLFSRQVVGWAMGERMTRHLVIDALTMAWFRRRPAEGLIFHFDQGSQYASSDFQATLRGYAMHGSMSRKGNCWDNAVTETLFGSLKVERLHGMGFETRRQAQDEVIDWLAFYNRRRMHSTLGYTSPMAFEENWRRQQKVQAA